MASGATNGNHKLNAKRQHNHAVTANSGTAKSICLCEMVLEAGSRDKLDGLLVQSAEKLTAHMLAS